MIAKRNPNHYNPENPGKALEFGQKPVEQVIPVIKEEPKPVVVQEKPKTIVEEIKKKITKKK